MRWWVVLVAVAEAAWEIHVPGGVINTLDTPSWHHRHLRARQGEPESLPESQWYIQTHGPLSAADISRLEDQLEQPLSSYVPDYTFIILGPEELAFRAAKDPVVRWVGPRRPRHKLEPSLRTIRSDSQDKEYMLTALLMPGTTDDQRAEIYQSLSQIASSAKHFAVGRNQLLITAPIGRVHKIATMLASWSSVTYVGTHPKFVARNFFTTKLTANAGPVEDTATIAGLWSSNDLYNIGLTGADETVGIADTGIDWDNCFFRDADHPTPPINTEDPTRRKIVAYYNYKNEGAHKCSSGTKSGTCGDEWDDDFGHGTHVTGTACGRAQGWKQEEVEAYNGVAYMAKVYFQDVGNATGALNVPWDYDAGLFNKPFEYGVRVHSDSWGCEDNPVCFTYMVTDSLLDEFMWNHKEFLIVIAAGNEGADRFASTVATPGNAKNILCVGASQKPVEGGRDSVPYVDPNRKICSNPTTSCCATQTCSLALCASRHYIDCKVSSFASPTYGADNVAPFSARGFSTVDLDGEGDMSPQAEGRIKPDIVMPGENIVSASSDGVAASSSGDDNTCTPPGPSNEPYNAKSSLTVHSGTSMSGPAAAGLALLVRQYFRHGFYPTGLPKKADEREYVSAALVKATIINSAERLTGLVKLGQSHSGAEYRSSPRGAGYFWNMSNSQVNGNKFSGFGLPRLARVLKGTQSFGTQSMFVDDNDSGVRTGDTVEYTVFNVDPTKELRVTLAWTDFPAPPGLERVLINDLDLVTTVTSGSAALPTNTQLYPNSLSGPDKVNNVERVILSPTTTTSGTITLSLKVSGVNVPSLGQFQSQEFALVVTGSFESANLTRSSNTYTNPRFIDTVSEGSALLPMLPLALIAVSALSLLVELQ